MKPISHVLPCLLACCFAGHALSQDRIPWTGSRVVGSPEPPKPYAVQRAYPKLEFKSPVEMMPLGDTGKMMLLELGGKLYTFDDESDCEQAELVLDLAKVNGSIHRAYGFGVHPDFANNGQIFVAYSHDPVARPEGTKLSRFTVSSGNPLTVDPNSEEVLLTWASGGHNGCAIRFDDAGLMYFSAGDGARPYPPDEYNVSQDLSDLRATICRIDVDHRDEDKPYAIPADNPFVDTEGARPEVWAFGFRNPWRFSIIPGTKRILCGDVGWELWELIHDVRRGTNHGWSIFEGPQPIRSDIKKGPGDITRPLISYPHSVGQSVTGGFVYQGDELPELKDVYLYGDYVTGLLWGIRHDEEPVVWNPVLAETGLRIISFAESCNKEMLLLDYSGGIYRLVRNPAETSESTFPKKLSQTGLFASTVELKPSKGVFVYDVAAQAWQDGATAEFVVGLPGESSIKTNKNQRAWKHPKDAVFAKTLSRNVVVDGKEKPQRIETQLLHFDGLSWQPYSYLWNATQTDADLVPAEGATKSIRVLDDAGAEITREWRVSNRAECRACHTPQTGGAVGFTLANLGEEQTGKFVELRVLDRAPPPGWKIRYMVAPDDTQASLEARARSYLMANCAHCHRRGGGGTVPLDLIFSNRSEAINAVDVAPTQGAFGIQNAKVIAPGDPYRSVLYYRMATSGAGHMPKLWSRPNDADGLRLVHDWIASLGDPPDDAGNPGETSHSLRLFSNLMTIPANAEGAKRKEIVSQLLESASPTAMDLAERFLPPEERRQRLGEHIDPDKILAMAGNAAHGRSRFFAGQSQQCLSCHRVQGTGNSVGPDLDGVGKKRDRSFLLTSIIEPSKDIEKKYTTHMVLTAAGVVHNGLLIRENNQRIVIQTSNGKNVAINRNQIEARKVSESSMMPIGLAAQMTAQELADLLAFLQSLK